MTKGSCLCGGVAFEFDNEIELRNCHCSRCSMACRRCGVNFGGRPMWMPFVLTGLVLYVPNEGLTRWSIPANLS